MVPASAVIDLPLAFLTVPRSIRAGTPLSGVFTLGVERDVVRFVPNPGLSECVRAPARQQLDSVAASLMAGDWQSPVSWRTPTPAR